MSRRVVNNEFAQLVRELRDEGGRPLSNKQVADLTFPHAMTKGKRGGKPKKRKEPYSSSQISNVRNGELPSKQMAEAFDKAFPKRGFMEAYNKVVGPKVRGSDGEAPLSIDSGRQEAENQTERNRRVITKLANEIETVNGDWHVVYEVEPYSNSFAERVVVGTQKGDEGLIADSSEGGRHWKLDCILDGDGSIDGVARIDGIDARRLFAQRKTSSLIVGRLVNYSDVADDHLIVLARDRDRARKHFYEEQERRRARMGRTAIDLTTTTATTTRGDNAHEEAPSAHGGVTRHTGAGLAGTVHSFPPRDARQRRHR